MRKSIVCGVIALALAGCATSPYGNHLQSATVDQAKLAAEAAKQLAVSWSPARTRFELQQPTPDAFGAALVKSLRESGYAVAEFDPNAARAASADAPPAAPAAPALALAYVLDGAGPGMYRLTLTVGAQAISRPYIEQDGALLPAGQWSRKE